MPLIYDAAGVDGEGWYSEELECGANTVRFRLFCDNPGMSAWGFTVYCNASQAVGSVTGTCDFDAGLTVAVPTGGDCCDNPLTGVVTN